jgi:hypothetical protein
VTVRINIRVKDYLGKTFTIPEIYENNTSMIPSPVRPAHQDYFLACIGGIKITAIMCPFLDCQKIGQSMINSL